MKTKIYLCGGMHDNWRNKIIEKYPNDFLFIDPCKQGERTPSEYTTWDIYFIKQCDILFAYMDKENPSGYGLMLEIGYAKALNKTVIFIDEKQNKYFKIAQEISDIVFDNLEYGIKYLGSFINN